MEACLRMDDTNPEKENDEYVNSIKESVKWLGFDWVIICILQVIICKFYDFSALTKNQFAYMILKPLNKLKLTEEP